MKTEIGNALKITEKIEDSSLEIHGEYYLQLFRHVLEGVKMMDANTPYTLKQIFYLTESGKEFWKSNEPTNIGRIVPTLINRGLLPLLIDSRNKSNSLLYKLS